MDNIGKRIPIAIILISIAVFLFLLVFIASKAFNNSSGTNKVLKVEKNSTFPEEILKPLIITKDEDALIFNTKDIDDDTLYICAGKFDDSSLSIWLDGVLIYNQIYSGPYGFVFYKNRSIVNQGFYKVFDVYSDQITKNIGIDLTKIVNTGSDLSRLQISVNNASCKVYVYSKNVSKNFDTFKSIEISDNNQDIESFIPLLKNYDTSEFGIVNYIKNSYMMNHALDKLRPERRTNEWYYSLNPQKKYLFAYMKNLYNLEIIIGDYKVNTNKNKNPKSLEILEIEKGTKEIIIKNKDEEIKVQDLNSDFIDIFSSPLAVYNQFVYGKEKKITESKNKINYKVCCFEKP